MLSLSLELEAERIQSTGPVVDDFDECDVGIETSVASTGQEKPADFLSTSSIQKVLLDAKKFLDAGHDSVSASSTERVDAVNTSTTHKGRKISRDAEKLLNEIRSLPPPELELTKPGRISPAQLQAEDSRRNRIPALGHPVLRFGSGKESTSMDFPTALVPPSVTVHPLPLDKIPSFEDILQELGVPQLVNPKGQQQPLYMVDCRVVSQTQLKDLILKRAKILVEKMEAKKINRGAQTFVRSSKRNSAFEEQTEVGGWSVDCTFRQEVS